METGLAHRAVNGNHLPIEEKKSSSKTHVKAIPTYELKKRLKAGSEMALPFLNFGELLSVLVEHLDGQKAAICKPFIEKMVGIW